jgi:hypothetical protein
MNMECMEEKCRIVLEKHFKDSIIDVIEEEYLPDGGMVYETLDGSAVVFCGEKVEEIEGEKTVRVPAFPITLLMGHQFIKDIVDYKNKRKCAIAIITIKDDKISKFGYAFC